MPSKSILLIITGSIAAYKSLELIRQLKDKNIAVTCVLTEGGARFITPLACASLTGNPVHGDLFSLKDEIEMGHIQLSRKHNLILVAPASADILAKMAHGLADDLASAILLATDKQVIVAPAMNIRMWQNPATQRNIGQLKKDGISFVGPSAGSLACGEEGEGRMAEPSEITGVVQAFLETGGDRRAGARPLKGLKAIVTSGPTIEAIDPVRYIANRSTGKQGHAIATALEMFGAEVTLVSGPTALSDPQGIRVVHVESAREMLDACEKALPADIAICAAAVADWRATDIMPQKIKKKPGEDMAFTFMENPDILECLGKKRTNRPRLIIGFAAETENIVKNAKRKRERKGCDWMLANDVSGGAVFGKDENTIHFIAGEKVENWPTLSKTEIAHRLAQRIGEYFRDNKTKKSRLRLA